ncbi:MAG: TorD/DmsD family molecular chaperone [Desulfocapsaceae bacterium]
MVSQTDAITRGNCFKLLAACFYEPEKDLFVEENLCQNLRDLLDGWASGAAKAASDMGLALSNLNQEELSISHAELFIGPFELIAPPYGSVYLEKNRQIMGDTTIDVLKSYEEAGLSVDEKEPSDHIAIELEFMSFLSTREAEARAQGNTIEAENFFGQQKDFYNNYLRWVPNFCEAIKKGTKSPFYQSLADCLDRLIMTCQKCYGAPQYTQP